jgi:hypothetical protein
MSASRTSLDGTWKPVYLASRNADHIVRACIHSDNSGKVKATVFLHRPIIEDCELLVEILESSGAPLAETRDMPPPMPKAALIPSIRIVSLFSLL